MFGFGVEQRARNKLEFSAQREEAEKLRQKSSSFTPALVLTL